MGVLLLLLAGLVTPAMGQTAAPPANAPSYTADGIVNTAADIPNWFAPNTFLAIFGQNLATTTQAIAPSDTASGTLPMTLPGSNVFVIVNGLPAYPQYVSPNFVNVLLPVSLGPGPATVQLESNGIAGPAVTINLGAFAPVLTTQNETTPTGETTLFAMHSDATFVTQSSPASAGETVYLFASGLGQVNPLLVEDQMPVYPGQIANLSSFSLLMNGTPLPPGAVSYVGSLPGAAGIYPIIVTLPNPLPHNPEIRISIGGVLSPPQKVLDTQ